MLLAPGVHGLHALAHLGRHRPHVLLHQRLLLGGRLSGHLLALRVAQDDGFVILASDSRQQAAQTVRSAFARDCCSDNSHGDSPMPTKLLAGSTDGAIARSDRVGNPARTGARR